MATIHIINDIGEREGWNDETKLMLCLEYIENQGDNGAFEEFLKGRTEEGEGVLDYALRTAKPRRFHRYPTMCPQCSKDLTEDGAVIIHVTRPGMSADIPTRLDNSGYLEEPEGYGDPIASGLHAGTECGGCSENLADHEQGPDPIDPDGRNTPPGPEPEEDDE